MPKLDYESMAEDIRGRFDALTEYEQWAVAAIMEAYDDSLEGALETVERGDFDFYPGIYSLGDLAYYLVEKGYFGDLETLGPLVKHIDYSGLGETLRQDCYVATSQGVVRLW